MEDLVLYCKSYKKDVKRVKILLESIDQHNQDNIPFYISTPLEDKELFINTLGNKGWTWVDDNEIYPTNEGWVGQQIVKSNFWKLNLCKNYLCLDSDSLFISPFSKNNFLYSNDIPYTVCHEQKDFFEWTQKNLPFDPQESFIKDRKQVMELFGRKGRIYDFGPSPSIWNFNVWKGLEENYTKPNNLKFSDLIQHCPSEFTWYGEYLLTSGVIPIYPAQPLFKVFHYKEQYIESKQKGITLKDLSKNYLGIILQSNWGAPLNY